MSNYLILPSLPSDISYIASDMMNEDAAEVKASGNYTPTSALTIAFMGSRDTKTVVVGALPSAMFGIGGSILSSRGIPWLLTTNRLHEYVSNRVFMKFSEQWVEQAKRRYSMLENYVDARHKRAIRWLRWMGFELEPSAAFGYYGLPFHHFTMKGELS